MTDSLEEPYEVCLSIVDTNEGLICLNEQLVTEEFAVFLSLEEHRTNILTFGKGVALYRYILLYK